MMLDTWAIHRMMNPILIQEAPKSGPADAVEFGSKTRTTDSWTLCDTQHKVKAYHTGTGEAIKDRIIVDYKLSDTAGWVKTGYHTEWANDHKIRINIYKDGKIAHQIDVVGSPDGWASTNPFLITGEGEWEVKFLSKSSGECSKPSGESSVGKFTATPYVVADEDEGEDEDDSSKDGDYTSLYIIGGVLVLTAIILKRKRRK